MINKIHKQGEKLLMKIYKSRLIPISKLTEMARIINNAYKAGNEDPKT